MERWDIYDMDRIKTGETMERGEAFAPGTYHLVVHVCVFNKKGELLIQQRQPFKKGFSNLWDITVGGSALAGESSQSAAERELMEELGIKADLQGVRPYFTMNFPQGFDEYYLIQQEINLEDLTLQYEEVQAARWASKEEIFQMVDSGEFVPYYKGILQLMFENRRRYGAYNVDE